MYIKKDEKIKIIKWYIKKYIRIDKTTLDNVNDLKDLENIVRTHEDCFGKISKCKACHYDGKDFCHKCANCIAWNWDKDITETKDNYVFPYGYYKSFYEYAVVESNQIN